MERTPKLNALDHSLKLYVERHAPKNKHIALHSLMNRKQLYEFYASMADRAYHCSLPPPCQTKLSQQQIFVLNEAHNNPMDVNVSVGKHKAVKQTAELSRNIGIVVQTGQQNIVDEVWPITKSQDDKQVNKTMNNVKIKVNQLLKTFQGDQVEEKSDKMKPEKKYEQIINLFKGIYGVNWKKRG